MNKESFYTQRDACMKFLLTPEEFVEILHVHEMSHIKKEITLLTAPDSSLSKVDEIHVAKKDFELALEIYRNELSIRK
ncbi:hypothetical protein ACFOG5_22760 [Pedobacter fastidiosus]|uniref:DUF2007 domain-containing protein n=1 Tax=Pedobacter fastidiosus TaxID=2765361 RepID=A0ABR7KTT5_9SPHI|nr:hypothetical protein [Pedobacter fastidiosus]MBC6111418.1 hypothetical protein [Pedobacter fastidiosus]